MLSILCFELLGQPNIYENDVALLVEHDIVELDVCVNVSLWVKILDALYQFNPNNDGVFVSNTWTSPDLFQGCFKMAIHYEVSVSPRFQMFCRCYVINLSMVQKRHYALESFVADFLSYF